MFKIIFKKFMKISLIYLLFDLFCDNNYSKDIKISTAQLDKKTEDLRKVAAWCCQNSLLINPDKMKLLLIGARQMLQNTLAGLDLHVTLLGKELCLVVSAKDLGVYMDATMSFDEHITSITSSRLSSLSQINRVKHLLDRKTLKGYMCFTDLSGTAWVRLVAATNTEYETRQLKGLLEEMKPWPI